jgi:acyl-CoA-binding protein
LTPSRLARFSGFDEVQALTAEVVSAVNFAMSTSLETEFEQATFRAKALPPQSDDALLELYGLYKQATLGDVAGEEPGAFDFVGRAKFDAWASRRGMSRDDAMRAYVALVAKLAGASK